MAKQSQITRPNVIDHIIDMLYAPSHLGKDRIKPQGGFDNLLNDLVMSKNKDGFVIDQQDFYDSKYAAQGGLQGLADKRKAAGINQYIDPAVLQSMGVDPTFKQAHNPAQAILNGNQNILIKKDDLGNTTGGMYIKKKNEVILNDKATLNYRKSAINHEMYHGTQPIDDEVTKNYKKGNESGLDTYRNQQIETEARATQVLHDAMKSGVKPVYDKSTKDDFQKWLDSPAGKQSQQSNKLNPNVIMYLIDKIVDNRTAKQEDMA